MPTYSILNSRKRAIIALVHTVFFFGVALLTLHRAPGSHGAVLAMIGVYGAVTLALLVLVKYGRAAREKLYFALCASSAALGLLRFAMPHPAVNSAQILRPAALACAALVVTGIARGQSAR